MTARVEISKRLVLVNSISMMATRLVSVTVLLWMHQYLLKQLAPAEYAIYPVVMSIMVLAPLVNSLLTGGVARYIVEAYAQGDTQRVTRIVSSMVPLLTVAALGYAALGSTVAWFIGDILTVPDEVLGDARLMVWLMVLSQSVDLWLSPFSVGLYVRQKFVWLNVITVGSEGIRLALLLVLLLGVSPRVLWIIVALVASQAFGKVITLIVSQRLVPALRFSRAQSDWRTARSLTTFGAWTVLGGLAYRIHTSADALILNELSTPVAVASFHVGAMGDRQINGMASFAIAPIQPAITAMHTTGNTDGVRRAYLRGNRYMLWFTMLPAVPLITFATSLIELYIGDTYITAATVLLLLSASYPFSSACTMLYQVAFATARMGPFMILAIAKQIFNVALTVYAVGGLGLGAAGAALSTFTATALFEPLLLWPLGLRMLELSLQRFMRETVVPGLLPAAVAFAACLALSAWRKPDDWFTLGVFAGISCLVYGATLLPVALQTDRKDLTALVTRVLEVVRGSTAPRLRFGQGVPSQRGRGKG